MFEKAELYLVGLDNSSLSDSISSGTPLLKYFVFVTVSDGPRSASVITETVEGQFCHAFVCRPSARCRPCSSGGEHLIYPHPLCSWQCILGGMAGLYHAQTANMRVSTNFLDLNS